VRFATKIEEHGFDYRTLLEDIQLEDLEENSNECRKEKIDIPYIQDVFKLLVIGGYVKYWKAWDELSQWFLQQTDDESIRTWIQTEFPNQKMEKNCLCTINKYVFENY
jgi:hypothetical protein